MAYVTRDWRTILQSISALHLFTPLLMNYVPESPRWLLARNNKGGFPIDIRSVPKQIFQTNRTKPKNNSLGANWEFLLIWVDEKGAFFPPPLGLLDGSDHILGAQTFSLLCIFIFYVVKFSPMIPQSICENNRKICVISTKEVIEIVFIIRK